jgi:GTP cyclohydrolase I
MEKIDLSWNEVLIRAKRICEHIVQHRPDETITVYGIPRGGIFPALMVAGILDMPCILTESPAEATVFVDDIIDSGRTEESWKKSHPNKPFYALVDKLSMDADWTGAWISFPWERMGNEDSPSENIRRLLQYIGEDSEREGLKETPDRVIRSYATLFGGYKQNPQDVMKVFEDGACDEMVLLKGIEFSSCCEHHMLPFIGKAHIAYIPNGKVIGVSKLARILDIYARRLQIQERIGQQVTQCLMEYLQPKGAACILQAQHLCMTCRGVQKQDSVMVTSSLRGVFLEKPETRAEFLSMVRG